MDGLPTTGMQRHWSQHRDLASRRKTLTGKTTQKLKTASQIAAEELADPGIRREHERTALAHAVAIRVIGYGRSRPIAERACPRAPHAPARDRAPGG